MAINPNDITTIRVGDLPSSAFSLTDKIPHEVGTDLKQGTIQDLIDFISPFVNAIQFQVITLHVNSAYIAANFDGTGLGINLMAGYAICNGNNGTLNKDGRVGIAYGATKNVIGQFGGATTSNVTAQISGFAEADHHPDTGDSGKLLVGSGVHESSEILESIATASAPPSSQSISIMQPYIVELQVMKL